MDKRFLLVLVGLAVILGGVFYFTNSHNNDGSNSKGSLTNNVEGATSAKVTLVEYGDYQCPACAQYYAPTKQAVSRYKNQIKFQFRNFPLSSIHPNALAAARAAQAAGLQDKFWEMHDKLYTENYTQQVAQASGSSYSTWVDASAPLDLFKTYAAGLGLDTAKFEKDFKSSAVNGSVQADLAEGSRLGVDSTPTFFINGKKITNPNITDPKTAVDNFSKAIESALKKAGITPAPVASDASPAETLTEPTTDPVAPATPSTKQ